MGDATGSDRTWTHPAGPADADATLATPHLFLVFAAAQPLAATGRFSLRGVSRVLIGRGAPGAEVVSDGGVRCLSLRLPDRWMSTRHARLERVLDSWLLEDAGSKNGTLRNGELSARAALADGDLIEVGQTLLLFRAAIPLSPDDPSLLWTPGGPGGPGGPGKSPSPLPGMMTLLPPLSRALARLEDIARSTVSVVLHGESGTGKEVLARAVHKLSGRPGPFVAVNCGALPATLLESELFGHRRGAFSGAVEDRPGLVRSADRGTLFLDEIGDLPAASQAALLRVLQEGEVLPVGATQPVRVDLRVLSATHRDLSTLVAEGAFRPDLYARLAGYTMTLPPLRERREDLGLLLAALLPRVAPAHAASIRFTAPAARALLRHAFPFNVRELEKCLAAAVVLAHDGLVGEEHLPAELGLKVDRPTGEDTRRREELIALFRAHHGNVSAVARAMGKARLQIQRWVKRYGIDPASFRGS